MGLSGAAASLQNSAAQTAINAAQQKAQQAYWEALASGADKDRAEKAAEFAATNELAKQSLALQAQQQGYTQGMGVLDLVSKLQGPANAFTQQAVLHGLDANGLSRSVGALSGSVLPTFEAPQATPQAASLDSLIAQIYPGATFGGASNGNSNGNPSIGSIMGWAGSAASPGSAALTGDNLRAYQVLTAAGSPAAGTTQDQFQAYINANGGNRPADANALAAWTKGNPASTAANTAPAGGGVAGGSSWTGASGNVTAPAPAPSPYADPTLQAQARQLMGTAKDYAPGTVFTPADIQASGGYANHKTNGFNEFGGVDPLTSDAWKAAGTGSTGTGTTADYVNALPAPNKINAPNWQQLDPDTKQFLLGAYRQAGYSDNDVLNAVQNTLPRFNAPATGSFA